MAAAAISTENTKVIMECPICLETLDSPTGLICGHTICGECVKELLSKSSKSNTIKCPNCRKLTIIPAEGLPVIYQLQDLLELVKKQNEEQIPAASEPSFAHNCGDCSKGLNPSQVWVCQTECNKLLCAECGMKNHQGHRSQQLQEILGRRRAKFGQWLSEVEQSKHQIFLAEELGNVVLQDVGNIVNSAVDKLISLVPMIHDAFGRLKDERDTVCARFDAMNADEFPICGQFDKYLQDISGDLGMLIKKHADFREKVSILNGWLDSTITQMDDRLNGIQMFLVQHCDVLNRDGNRFLIASGEIRPVTEQLSSTVGDASSTFATRNEDAQIVTTTVVNPAENAWSSGGGNRENSFGSERVTVAGGTAGNSQSDGTTAPSITQHHVELEAAPSADHERNLRESVIFRPYAGRPPQSPQQIPNTVPCRSEQPIAHERPMLGAAEIWMPNNNGSNAFGGGGDGGGRPGAQVQAGNRGRRPFRGIGRGRGRQFYNSK